MKMNLLVIERKTQDALAGRLAAEGYSIFHVETASAALEALGKHTITHLCILNAVSLRSPGTRICVYLKRAAPDLPILVYTDRDKPAKADLRVKHGSSIRKLMNRIELYSPLDENECLRHDEICLDEHKQRVFTPGGVAHLPTKCAQILKLLIKKGERLLQGRNSLNRYGRLSTQVI